MSLTLFKTFLTIVETGSLIKASRVLNITQSTVTSRLKSLELEIGQQLLHRQKSGIVLTSSGLKFLRYAKAMSNLWQQALIETSLPVGMEAVCNLGCDFDLWPGIGRKLVKTIRRDHATTALNIHHATSAQLDDWLGIGTIDAALTYQPGSAPNTTTIPLPAEPLVLYSATPNSPVRGDPNYTYYDAGTEFGSQHAATYADAGVGKHSFNSAITIRDFLLDCGGSAYLPHHIGMREVERGTLHELSEAPRFSRKQFLVINNKAVTGWPWLTELVRKIATDP